ncbi:uncharacterized protein LOC105848775 isoform X1 [Hydra vulgaris]|uniref:uncharacterized protein LOC105848775 isoform X1 n=1 Tax=Hydra vulgaris TaxID=6087 RepID=UPI000641049D|nr:uncharacterized protein LOC105848775 [Hydra vulgaris]
MWRQLECFTFTIIFGFFLCDCEMTMTYINSTFTGDAKVDKFFPDNLCYRTYNDGLKNVSSQLNSLLVSNPVTCSTTARTNSLIKRKRRAIVKELLKELANKPKRRSRRDGSYSIPSNLPNGSTVAYCSNPSCCTNKRTLKSPSFMYYNLCRECVHLITLPAGYTPQNHFHVTCQDIDYSTSCLMGEGACITNLATKTISVDTNINPSGQIFITVGQSCSCDILHDSIFSDFIV